MAASGYTPISLYYSSTPDAEPLPGNLVDGELALNIADGKLFYKDDAGDIQAFTGGAGSSGYSGFSGFSGASGTSGFSGYSGQAGAASASGYSGYSGFSGYSGGPGANGTSGFSGYSGYSGAGFSFPNFTVTQVGSKLVFSYGATAVASLDSTGNFITLQNITAYGTP